MSLLRKLGRLFAFRRDMEVIKCPCPTRVKYWVIVNDEVHHACYPCLGVIGLYEDQCRWVTDNQPLEMPKSVLRKK
jgi:hypothetical protein